MAEGRGAQRQDRGAHLRVRDHLDAKDVGESRAAVAPECAKDEVLTFLVKN